MHVRLNSRLNLDVLIGCVSACIVSCLSWSSNSHIFFKGFFGGNLQLKKEEMLPWQNVASAAVVVLLGVILPVNGTRETVRVHI